MRIASPIFFLALACGATLALAQTPPDYGFTWKTIGDPGNPGASPTDYPHLEHPVGQVDYSYRLTQTEVTYSQWIQFVDAYSRVNPTAPINDPQFTGIWVDYTSNDPNNRGWTVWAGAENAPAQMGWLYAARYVNWLQNGKAMTLQAFETGVYNMSTFVPTSDSEWTGQTTHAPGASFWIPSLDEWTKGMHWDPDKNGPSQGGYWAYPNSSDTPPVGGPPGTPGAQTNAYGEAPIYMAVGQYPDQRSPWGLLDGSGGATEYLEGWEGSVYSRGSEIRDDSTWISDRLDVSGLWRASVASGGLRIASTVPAPGFGATVLILMYALKRRDRRVSTSPDCRTPAVVPRRNARKRDYGDNHTE